MPGDGGLDRGDGSWRLSPGRGPARSAQLCPDTQIAMLSFISQCWSSYSRHTASLSAGTQHDCSRSLSLCEEILPSLLRGAARRHRAGEVSL